MQCQVARPKKLDGILKGFKTGFTSETSSRSSKHDASDCDKSSSFKVTLYRPKLNQKMSLRAVMSYYTLSSKLPSQVMNTFVWIPSGKAARCLWDYCHHLESQCEPSLHHTQSHALNTSPYLRKVNLEWEASARSVSICISHQLRK